MTGKRVKFINMDITCQGQTFKKVKIKPNTGENIYISELRTEEGNWFEKELPNGVLLNILIFFREGFKAKFVRIELIDGKLQYHKDTSIVCDNIKVTYTS